MPTTTILPAAPQTTARAAKYLTFALAEETYAIDIVKVREIITYGHVTPVPGVAGYVKGVINLRGQVLPVIDLRQRFGMPTTKSTAQTCIIIVDARARGAGALSGLIVDRVLDVAAIATEKIEAAPSLGANVATEFFAGIAKVDQGVTMLLAVDQILGSADAAAPAPSETAAA